MPYLNRIDLLNQNQDYHTFLPVAGKIPWKVPVPNLEKSALYSGSYIPPNGTNPFKLSPKNPYCVKKFAQRLAIHHCHLSNIYRFKYLGVPDVDEIFVPRQHKTLPDLFNHLENTRNMSKYGSITFSQAYFCMNGNGKRMSGTRSGLHSSKRLPVTFRNPKTIMKPDKTVSAGIHNVHAPLHGYTKLNLNSKLGVFHHYRIPNECQNKSTVNDSILLPYLKLVAGKVEDVKAKLKI